VLYHCAFVQPVVERRRVMEHRHIVRRFLPRQASHRLVYGVQSGEEEVIIRREAELPLPFNIGDLFVANTTEPACAWLPIATEHSPRNKFLQAWCVVR